MADAAGGGSDVGGAGCASLWLQCAATRPAAIISSSPSLNFSTDGATNCSAKAAAAAAARALHGSAASALIMPDAVDKSSSSPAAAADDCAANIPVPACTHHAHCSSAAHTTAISTGTHAVMKGGDGV